MVVVLEVEEKRAAVLVLVWSGGGVRKDVVNWTLSDAVREAGRRSVA